MATMIVHFPDPLRLASYVAVTPTLIASWAGTGLGETASVWCWLAAIIGPVCVAMAAARA